MPHLINKMPQCHNPLITLSLAATKCHTNATVPHAPNLLIFNDATNATSATSFCTTYVYGETQPSEQQKAPRKNTFFPRAMI